MRPRFRFTARSWVLLALPGVLALGACDRSPTEPVALPEGLDAAQGGKPTPNLIAFASTHEFAGGAIYTIRPDGTDLRRLTTPAAGQTDRQPNIAPDGRSVVFRRGLGGALYELFSVSLKSRKVTQLTSFNAATHHPAYSPDGSRIAFTSTRDGSTDLYVMNADGTNLQQLTNDVVHEQAPSWFPGGTHIAYGRQLAPIGYPSEIVQIELATLQTMVRVGCPEDTCGAPRLSRVTNEMIYEWKPQDPNAPTQLRRRNLTTSIDLPWETQYANFVGEWSPDAAAFVFTSTKGGSHTQFALFVRTGQNPAVQITNLPSGSAFDPTWSR